MSRREYITDLVRKSYGGTKEEQDRKIQELCGFFDENIDTLRRVSAERRAVWNAEAALGTEKK